MTRKRKKLVTERWYAAKHYTGDFGIVMFRKRALEAELKRKHYRRDYKIVPVKVTEIERKGRRK